MKNDYGRGGDRRKEDFRRGENKFERRENDNRNYGDRRPSGEGKAFNGNRPAGRDYGERRGFEGNRGRYDGGEGRNGRPNGDDRKNYGGNRMQGAGRRIYAPEGPGPRVGRIADDVPKAMRISGDKPMHPPKREQLVDRDFKPRRPAPMARPEPRYDYEPPEIPEDLLAEFDDVPFESENLLVGRNPIREAIRAGRPMEKLLVATGDLSGAAKDIIKMAKEANVIVQYVDRSRLDQLYPAHQGMLAYVAAVPYVSVEDILENAKNKGEDPFIILLDGITDPHNLGAIIRSAECAGAHGVIVPERRAAGLGPTAAKAAAGALNHMPIARVKNLNRTIEQLKSENIWVIGTAMDGEDAFTADLTGPVALVIGSEGDGISRLTLEKCDRKLTLPMKGHIESLNASVAAGVLMYAIARARTL